MTDIHYGRQTLTFNPAICATRIARIGDRLTRIRDLLSDYDFDELIIMLGGDANDGTDIYANQSTEQAISDVNQQALRLSAILEDFARSQLSLWKSVRFECVPGNHGRAGSRAAVSANWDIVCYNYLRLGLKGSGIQVGINGAGTDPFIRKVAIRGHNYILYHGHDIRTFASIPWYGLMLRVLRWYSTGLGPFDAAIFGHFHSFGLWPVNRIRILESGTMITDDGWALRTFGWESTAQWWLFGVSNSRAMTWQFPIDVGA